MQIKPAIKTLSKFLVAGIPCITDKDGQIVSLCTEGFGISEDFESFVELGSAEISRSISVLLKKARKKLRFSAEKNNAPELSENFPTAKGTANQSECTCKALCGKPVSALWDVLSKYENKLQNHIKNGVSYGVEFGFDRASGVSCYVAGFPVKEGGTLHKCFAEVEIPPQTYAVFPCTLNTLRDVYNYIYKEWLPNSPFQRTNGLEFEFYGKDFKGDNPNSLMHLYIPVRKKF